jgi:hypothetical protein
MRMSSGGPDGKGGSIDDDQCSLASMSPQVRQQDEKLLEHIVGM